MLAIIFSNTLSSFFDQQNTHDYGDIWPHCDILTHTITNILQNQLKLNQNRTIFALYANYLSTDPVNFET
tara:strand:- start:576 stop:785 length:210 start_codon:yes stop_codon:yes gene_type:complete